MVSLPRRAFYLERGALKNGAEAFFYLLGYVFSFILLCVVLFNKLVLWRLRSNLTVLKELITANLITVLHNCKFFKRRPPITEKCFLGVSTKCKKKVIYGNKTLLTKDANCFTHDHTSSAYKMVRVLRRLY